MENFPKIEKLKILRCTFGVPNSSAYEDGFLEDCGEPAEFSITWPGEENDKPFYVCECHAQKIEEEAEKEGSIEIY